MLASYIVDQMDRLWLCYFTFWLFCRQNKFTKKIMNIDKNDLHKKKVSMLLYLKDDLE